MFTQGLQGFPYTEYLGPKYILYELYSKLYTGGIWGSIIEVIKGDTRTLDYSIAHILQGLRSRV